MTEQEAKNVIAMALKNSNWMIFFPQLSQNPINQTEVVLAYGCKKIYISAKKVTFFQEGKNSLTISGDFLDIFKATLGRHEVKSRINFRGWVD